MLRRAQYSLAQRLALDVFHDDVVCAPGFCRSLADLVNGDDVRMIEGGGYARLLREAPHAPCVSRELGRQQFYGDFAAELRVLGQPDLTHPAFTQQREHSVVREAAL